MGLDELVWGYYFPDHHRDGHVRSGAPQQSE
jgi:hypothetical protein